MYRREYPIRCKSCNEQLACYSEKYELLARAYGYEQALNMLGIMEPCSRYNMMNPVMILNIKENRNLIEGLEDIDVIDKFSQDLSFQKCEHRAGNSNYSQRREEIKPERDQTKSLPIMNVTGRPTVQKQTYLTSISPIRPTQRQALSSPVPRVIPSRSRAPLNIMSPAKQASKSIILDPIDEAEPEDETDLVRIRQPEIEKEVEFKYPTTVGMPTINPSGENVRIHISGKYYAEVLSGRTYICR